MPFYNPNAYYNPLDIHGIGGIFGGPLGVSGLYGGHGIFGIYGSQTDFLKDLQGRLDTPAPTPAPRPPGVRTPVVPPKPAPGWEGVRREYPDPMIEIERELAAGGPYYNPTTGKFENVPDEKIVGGTEKVGGGTGGAGQEAQNYGILPWVGASLYGLNTLGQLYLGWRALNQARDQFNYQRELANQNLANSIQAYNNALRSRIRGRSGAFTDEDVDRMMEDQKLKDTRKRK